LLAIGFSIRQFNYFFAYFGVGNGGNYDTTPKFLFEAFQTITSKEFAFLRNEPETTSKEILEDLHQFNLIKKFQSPSGNMWINNYAPLEED
jgi:hypothetical protein